MYYMLYVYANSEIDRKFTKPLTVHVKLIILMLKYYRVIAKFNDFSRFKRFKLNKTGRNEESFCNLLFLIKVLYHYVKFHFNERKISTCALRFKSI